MELNLNPHSLLLLLLPALLSSSSECTAERSGLKIRSPSPSSSIRSSGLRFGKKRAGEFKVLQVADMHYADGRSTGCLDVFESQLPTCSDLNTTAFIYRVIRAEKPDLVVFTEYSSFDASNFTGVKQEGISSPQFNSGFFNTMVEAGDVKAVFTGHDHLNDFCGELSGIQLCYAGGFGYHAYGKAGWSRRARVVSAYLEKSVDGKWGGVKSIKTWNRLDDAHLSTINSQVLWSKHSNGRHSKGAVQN